MNTTILIRFPEVDGVPPDPILFAQFQPSGETVRTALRVERGVIYKDKNLRPAQGRPAGRLRDEILHG